MSLRDIIDGAREEAQQAASQRTSSSAADAATEEAPKKKAGASYARKTAANARPTRELAGSVRVEGKSSKPRSEMTKEERKAAREERRAKEDVVYGAKTALLEQIPGYKHTQRVWWGMLIAGIVFTIASWGIMQLMRSQGSENESMAVASVVLMVIAYVLVIGSFIYDLVKVRPMRKQADQKLTGMSKRRMQRVIDEDERRKAEEKANK